MLPIAWAGNQAAGQAGVQLAHCTINNHNANNHTACRLLQGREIKQLRVPGWAWTEVTEPRVVPLATNALYYLFLVVSALQSRWGGLHAAVADTPPTPFLLVRGCVQVSVDCCVVQILTAK